MSNQLKVKLSDSDVEVTMETKYPWENKVEICFQMQRKTEFGYAIRIPMWCGKYSIKVNGQDAQFTIEDGYALIKREWSDGDKISLVFDMPVSIIQSNPKVRSNIGKVAVMRGPIVYCLEEADNGKDLHLLSLGDKPDFKIKQGENLLSDVKVITVDGFIYNAEWQGKGLYAEAINPSYLGKCITMIPYHTWANRGTGEMRVWIHR